MERQSFAGWLAENPDVDALVQQAVALAEREAKRFDLTILNELAEQHRLDSASRGIAVDELRDVLARLVAAREELANGSSDETASILYDLETDVGGLIEGAA